MIRTDMNQRTSELAHPTIPVVKVENFQIPKNLKSVTVHMPANRKTNTHNTCLSKICNVVVSVFKYIFCCFGTAISENGVKPEGIVTPRTPRASGRGQNRRRTQEAPTGTPRKGDSATSAVLLLEREQQITPVTTTPRGRGLDGVSQAVQNALKKKQQ